MKGLAPHLPLMVAGIGVETDLYSTLAHLLNDTARIMGSVLLITFEVFVLHIVPAPLCTSIGSIVFKCEGKDTNLFSNIQIFNAEK